VQRHRGESDLNRVADPGWRLAILGEYAHLPVRLVRLIEHIKGRTPLRSLAIIDLAEIEKVALDHPAARAHAFHNAPVAVLLAILKTLVTLQVHAPIFAGNNPASMGWVCPTSQISKRTHENKG